MPGLLTDLFDDGGDTQSGSEGSAEAYDASANGGIDLSPSVGVSHDAEASWQDPDGTTHTYTSDTDVVLTVDAAATATATGSFVDSSFEQG